MGIYLASRGYDVILSDLPEVCDSILTSNLNENNRIIEENNGSAKITHLDWNMNEEQLYMIVEYIIEEKINLIIASDLSYLIK